MDNTNSLAPRVEVTGNVVKGYIDGSRAIQLCVENHEIITDVSTCLPVRRPERYIELYMACLERARTLLPQPEA